MYLFIYVCLLTQIEFDVGVEDSWHIHDLYYVSIITLVIVYIYPAWYNWADRI